MSKLLIRIVHLFLVPCLIVEPISVHAFSMFNTAAAPTIDSTQKRLLAEAVPPCLLSPISQRLTNTHHYFANLLESSIESSLEISVAQQNNFPELLELYESFFNETNSSGAERRAAKNTLQLTLRNARSAFVLVARLQGTVIGTLLGRRQKTTVGLSHVFVYQEFRRRGVMRSLLMEGIPLAFQDSRVERVFIQDGTEESRQGRIGPTGQLALSLGMERSNQGNLPTYVLERPGEQPFTFENEITASIQGPRNVSEFPRQTIRKRRAPYSRVRKQSAQLPIELIVRRKVLKIFIDGEKQTSGYQITVKNFPRPEDVTLTQLNCALLKMVRTGWLMRERIRVNPAEPKSAFSYRLAPSIISQLNDISLVDALLPVIATPDASPSDPQSQVRLADFPVSPAENVKHLLNSLEANSQWPRSEKPDSEAHRCRLQIFWEDLLSLMQKQHLFDDQTLIYPLAGVDILPGYYVDTILLDGVNVMSLASSVFGDPSSYRILYLTGDANRRTLYVRAIDAARTNRKTILFKGIYNYLHGHGADLSHYIAEVDSVLVAGDRIWIADDSDARACLPYLLSHGYKERTNWIDANSKKRIDNALEQMRYNGIPFIWVGTRQFLAPTRSIILEKESFPSHTEETTHPSSLTTRRAA